MIDSFGDKQEEELELFSPPIVPFCEQKNSCFQTTNTEFGYLGNFYGYGEQKKQDVSPFWIEKYETQAGKFWDHFYQTNGTHFFKNRHWLTREFVELNSTKERQAVLEVGCGVGNSLFPLSEMSDNLFFYALDFSPTAINLIKNSRSYKQERMKAFVCDITKKSIDEFLPKNSLDLVLMIFFLSAVSPEKMEKVLANLKEGVKKGGKILFRDYALNDMAQKRFEREFPERDAKKIGPNFYVRGDGTRAFYFTKNFLIEIFAKHGFKEERCEYITKDVENRKEQKKMHRVFLQAKFLKV